MPAKPKPQDVIDHGTEWLDLPDDALKEAQQRFCTNKAGVGKKKSLQITERVNERKASRNPAASPRGGGSPLSMQKNNTLNPGNPSAGTGPKLMTPRGGGSAHTKGPTPSPRGRDPAASPRGPRQDIVVKRVKSGEDGGTPSEGEDENGPRNGGVTKGATINIIGDPQYMASGPSSGGGDVGLGGTGIVNQYAARKNPLQTGAAPKQAATAPTVTTLHPTVNNDEDDFWNDNGKKGSEKNGKRVKKKHKHDKDGGGGSDKDGKGGGGATHKQKDQEWQPEVLERSADNDPCSCFCPKKKRQQTLVYQTEIDNA